MTEWLKVLAWKAGVGKPTEGSNPSPSANQEAFSIWESLLDRVISVDHVFVAYAATQLQRPNSARPGREQRYRKASVAGPSYFVTRDSAVLRWTDAESC